jgi:peroxiredoxin
MMPFFCFKKKAMKKITLFLAVSLLSSLVFAQAKFEISGTYKTPLNGVMRISVDEKQADSVPIVNGKFSYTGTAELPSRVGLMAIPKNRAAGLGIAGISLFVDQRATVLEIDTVTKTTSRFAYVDNKVNFLNKSSFQEKYDRLKAELTGLKASVEADRIKGHEKIVSSLSSLNSEKEKSIIVNRFSEFFEKEDLRNLYSSFSQHTKSSIYGIRIKNASIPKVDKKIGDKIADFAQADTDGKLISVADFKGKYLLIDFWASWCVPCRKENPNLVSAYQKYKQKGFDILGVSLDKDKANWLAAIKADGLTWRHVSDLQGWDNEVSKMFKITAVPSNILIDREGKIIALNLRGQALNQKLAEILL